MKRFVSRDTAHVPASGFGNRSQYNLFAYCLNDPIDNVDRGGHIAMSNTAKFAVGGALTIAAIAGIAIFASAAASVAVGVAVASVGTTLAGGCISQATGGSFVDGAANGALIGGALSAGAAICGVALGAGAGGTAAAVDAGKITAAANSCETLCEEQSNLDKIIELMKNGQRYGKNIINQLDEKTKVIFSMDVGEEAHPIVRKAYYEAVNHINIEIQRLSASGKYKTKWDYHIILDEFGNVKDYFPLGVWEK